MHFTVIGAGGFIGDELSKFLEKKNIEVRRIFRNTLIPKDVDLGVVIYCAGYGDCKKDPSNVIDANVNLLKEIVYNYNYKRLIYISSARLYLGNTASNEESDLEILNSDNRKLFNLTKLCAEEICLSSNKDNIVLRISNVYGKAIKSPLFLPSIIRDAIINRLVNMYVTPEYEKDYVYVGDVSDAIFQISNKPDVKYKVYNLASGVNTKASDIAQVIENKTGSDIKWHSVVAEDFFPLTDVSRIKEEIKWNPRNVLDDVSEMIDLFEKAL